MNPNGKKRAQITSRLELRNGIPWLIISAQRSRKALHFFLNDSVTGETVALPPIKLTKKESTREVPLIGHFGTLTAFRQGAKPLTLEVGPVPKYELVGSSVEGYSNVMNLIIRAVQGMNQGNLPAILFQPTFPKGKHMCWAGDVATAEGSVTKIGLNLLRPTDTVTDLHLLVKGTVNPLVIPFPAIPTLPQLSIELIKMSWVTVGEEIFLQLPVENCGDATRTEHPFGANENGRVIIDERFTMDGHTVKNVLIPISALRDLSGNGILNFEIYPLLKMKILVPFHEPIEDVHTEKTVDDEDSNNPVPSKFRFPGVINNHPEKYFLWPLMPIENGVILAVTNASNRTQTTAFGINFPTGISNQYGVLLPGQTTFLKFSFPTGWGDELKPGKQMAIWDGRVMVGYNILPERDWTIRHQSHTRSTWIYLRRRGEQMTELKEIVAVIGDRSEPIITPVKISQYEERCVIIPDVNNELIMLFIDGVLIYGCYGMAIEETVTA